MVGRGLLTYDAVMTLHQPVADPRRQIAEYHVYDLGGTWRAVHKVDPDLRFDDADWEEMFMAAWAARIRRSLQLYDQPERLGVMNLRD